MKKKDESLYKRQRFWFFSISAEGSSKKLEKEIIQKFDAFSHKHVGVQWALNPKVREADGFTTARAFVCMKNSTTLMAMKKFFSEAKFEPDFSKKSLWPYLCCMNDFTKEDLVYSENWKWNQIIEIGSQTEEASLASSTITVHIDNLFIITDKDFQTAILDNLRANNLNIKVKHS